MTPGSAAARLLGVGVRRAVPLGGATRVDLDDGRSVVVKRAHGAGATPAEAAGLRWLAVPGGPPVPEVLAVDQDWLVTGFVPTGGAARPSAAELGRRLAALHASGAPAFGAPPPDGPVDAWIGRAPMRNVTGPDWAEWYAAERVLPYLRTSRDDGTLTPAEASEIEAVCARLPQLAGPAEPPARLHGDLWSGNVLWAADGAWLIDPAAHGGHRETDLAMLALFGCPGLDELRAAYTEVTPLADGWRDRIPLHQLFPLLVHTVLFGRAYAAQAVAAARAAL